MTLLTPVGQSRKRALRRGARAGRQLRGALGRHGDEVCGRSQFDGIEDSCEELSKKLRSCLCCCVVVMVIMKAAEESLGVVVVVVVIEVVVVGSSGL
ncbi:hypothetical protein LZ32DRAFT_70021 [Colletotrichum eremochloae]|nr:hypothetical protein LZ32DRAFT_70021 [Colletotrichum eremochloae]